MVWSWRLVGLAFLAVFAACLLVGGSADARSGSGLTGYLSDVRQVCVQTSAGESLTERGVVLAQADANLMLGHGVYTDAMKLLERAQTEFQFAYVGVSVVSAPVGLGEPQANLRRGLRTEQRVAQRLLAVLREPASPQKNAVAVPVAVTVAQGGIQTANVEVSDWRAELIVRLRRAEVTVPLWLKLVGR